MLGTCPTAVADPTEGLNRGLIGIGQSVQVPLRGHDRRMPEALLHNLQVGTPGEQPGSV
jgi:hypothetical protein